ncbi:MAG: thioredoxin fold domain-containing protein, partial [Pseudomonadales bacterium]|nr:thioredoxin fold domain-containing protein [Pseudomonadales bacterium]
QTEVPGSVYDTIASVFNGATPTEVNVAPVPGLYEVLMGSEVYYLSGDGNYLLRGELYDIKNRVNLTDARRSVIRKQSLASLTDDELIIFKPDNPRHVVTVFTDVDCGYCAKLHSEIQGYLDEGIEVRYAAFPRGGIKSKTYDTMVSVWCSDDRNKALTDAKARRPVPPAQCANPVEKHYKLGSGAFGVSGTPTIVLENGDVIPGYVPPQR